MGKDVILCHRCLEAAHEGAEVVDDSTGMQKRVEMRAAQTEACEEDWVVISDRNCVLDKDGVVRNVFGNGHARVLVPPVLRQ
jgi:hypothetical protein